MNGKTRKWATMLAASILVVEFYLPAWAAAGGTTYNYSYDGCSWQLATEWFILDAPRTIVRDMNGQCHYLTAYARSSIEYHKVGPTTNASVWADMVNQGSFEGRGVITTWEHEWTQDSGWKFQKV